MSRKFDLPLPPVTTNDDAFTSRLKVEHGNTAQTTGLQFEVTQVADALIAPNVMRITATQPIDITSINMTVNVGGVSVQVFEASEGTASGTFTSLPVQSTNLRNVKAPTFSADGGGAFTPSGNPIRRMTTSTGIAAGAVSNTEENRNIISLPAGVFFIVTGLLSGVTSFTGQLLVTISEVLEP